MSDDIAIKIDHVSKSFKLPHEKGTNSVKSALVSWRTRERGYEMQHVLKDVSFEIKKGEFFGIVGRNGSGKSTLLKLISQIYSPDKGSITVKGKLTPFIELGVGFNPELSGRDNVYLNGALLGFNREEMDVMYDEIVAFAELGRFMDQKLKNYSSGMQVRLAFSVAIRANTDILVLDEVLAVGDAAFQQKCFDYFATVKAQKKTIILVSHSMASVERFCDRALLLEKGHIVDIGKSSDIAFQYENLFIEDDNARIRQHDESSKDTTVIGAGTTEFNVDVSIVQNTRQVKAVQARKPLSVLLDIMSKTPAQNINVGINIRNSEDQIVFSTDMRKDLPLLSLEAGRRVTMQFDIENYYTNGEYFVDVIIVNERSVADKVMFKEKSLASFNIKGVREHIHSMFHPKYSVKVLGEGDGHSR